MTAQRDSYHSRIEKCPLCNGTGKGMIWIESPDKEDTALKKWKRFRRDANMGLEVRGIIRQERVDADVLRLWSSQVIQFLPGMLPVAWMLGAIATVIEEEQNDVAA